MDFLHLIGVLLPRTSFIFVSIGVCLPNPISPPSIISLSSTLFPQNPNFIQLKIPFLFFSNNLSICVCIKWHCFCNLTTSSLNFLISICWAVTSRFEWHRAGGSSPRFGLRVPLKDPLQSRLRLRLNLVCSEKRTWITARTGRRSFCAAWREASGESFRLSISLHTVFLSSFDTPGCACS